MKRFFYCIFSLLFISQISISCEKDNIIEDFFIDNVVIDDSVQYNDSSNNQSSNSEDETHKSKIHFTTKIIGKGVIDVPSANFKALPSGQGMAIFNQYMFRLHKTGICCIYDLSDINDIKYVNSYKLGSYNASNHANCAQFDKNINPETGFPNLYVTNSYKKLFLPTKVEEWIETGL